MLLDLRSLAEPAVEEFTGTHTGDFQGLPATGRVIKISLTMIDKFVDGQLVEHYGDFDSAGLMQQLTQGAAA